MKIRMVISGVKQFVVRPILVMAVLCFPLINSSCKKDPTAEEVFQKKIAITWKPSSVGVQLDGKDVNGVFKDFRITFAQAKTYATQVGNSPIWLASGNYTLKASPAKAGFDILRDDGVLVSVSQLTDTNLVLTFQYVSKGARVGSVSGGYVFDLVPAK